MVIIEPYFTKRLGILTINLVVGMSFFLWSNAFCQVRGIIIDDKSNESLAGVSITLLSGKLLSFSNEKGYFYMNTTPSEKVRFSMVGYTRLDTLILFSEKILEIRLKANEYQLNEVVVKSTAENDFLNNVIKLNTAEIKKLPSLLGEKDIIKAIQLLPGVHSIVEGGSGFSVNGGGAEQNLVLVDNVPIYNFSHVFGLFSIFNTDAVKDVEFSKDAISAKYGGRSSSVLNIGLKEGNQNKWEGNGAVGITSSKITLNGPIIKEKLRALLSIRRSYLDAFTLLIPKNERQTYLFGDYIFKLSASLGKSFRMIAGAYNSSDKYIENRTQNSSANLSYLYPLNFGWKNNLQYVGISSFRNKLFFQSTIYQSKYNYFYNEKTILSLSGKEQDLFSISYQSKISDIGLNINFENQISSKTKLFFGAGLVNRDFQPKSIRVEKDNQDNEKVNEFVVSSIKNTEANIYFEDEWKPKDGIIFKAGIRNVFWLNPKTQYFLEPRVSVILGNGKLKTKISFFEINQFVHLLSNVGGSLPTDIWINANNYAKPSKSRQVAINFMNTIELAKIKLYWEAGVYAKQLKNVVDYNNGENIISMTESLSKDKENLSDIIEVGNGFSSGFEVFLKGNTPKIDVWGSYTLSRTYHKYNKINAGDNFFPNFDRLHLLKFAGIYHVNNKYSISSMLTLGSSNPISFPTGSYYSTQFVYPTEFSSEVELTLNNYRNNYRGSPYFRLDLGAMSKKKKKNYERIWELNIFNSTFNNNPIYYKLQTERYNIGNERIRRLTSTKVGFIRIVPSISYIINF